MHPDASLAEGFNQHVWEYDNARRPEGRDASKQQQGKFVQRALPNDQPEGEECDVEEVEEQDGRPFDQPGQEATGAVDHA